jgi:hypothetical protein
MPVGLAIAIIGSVHTTKAKTNAYTSVPFNRKRVNTIENLRSTKRLRLKCLSIETELRLVPGLKESIVGI